MLGCVSSACKSPFINGLLIGCWICSAGIWFVVALNFGFCHRLLMLKTFKPLLPILLILLLHNVIECGNLVSQAWPVFCLSFQFKLIIVVGAIIRSKLNFSVTLSKLTSMLIALFCTSKTLLYRLHERSVPKTAYFANLTKKDF